MEAEALVCAVGLQGLREEAGKRKPRGSELGREALHGPRRREEMGRMSLGLRMRNRNQARAP